MPTSPVRYCVQLLLIATASLTLTACGGGSSGGPTPPPASSSSSSSSSQDQSSSESESSSESSSENSSSSESSSSSDSSESSSSSSSESESSSSEPPDTVPDAFSFAPQSDVPRGAQLTSQTVTLTGLEAPANVAITGGDYAIDGGAFTSEPGQIDNDQTLTLRLTTAEAFDTATTATVTVGGVDASFTVTTLERDTTPEAFGFAPLDEQALGETVTSGEATITGINDAAEVTIENGQYAIDGGEFTSESGEIEEDQTLTVQTTTPDTPGTTQEAVVTVGGVEGTFAVTTVEDTDPPEAEFVFPTPMTATEADTVIVRGTAEDELSEVSDVALVVTSDGGSTTDHQVETDDDFATWQAEVDLGSGENTITLQAEDTEGNAIGEAERESVTVVSQAFTEAFPDDEVAIEMPHSLSFDEERDRVLVTDVGGRIVSVDLASGSRSVFLQLDEGNEVNVDSPSGMLLDASRSRLLVNGDTDEGASVLGVNLESKEVSVISSRETPSEDQPEFSSPRGMAVNPADLDQALVLATGSDNLATLDLTTGVRTLVSDNDMPDSGPEVKTPTQLLIDDARGRALVGQESSEGILSVDLSTGVRETFLAEDVPEGTPQVYASAVSSDDPNERVLVFEGFARSVWSVDMESRGINVISGPKVPHNHNDMGFIVDMDIASNDQFMVGVNDQPTDVNVLYAIDIVTGERLVISKPSGDVE